jgi:uncharacterized protein YkwD
VPTSKSILLFALAALASLPALAGEISSQVLAEINHARTQPREYAHIIASGTGGSQRDRAEAVRFLQKARPLPPLSSSIGLQQASLLHVAEQGPSGGRGHGFGFNSPFARMNKYGEWIGTAGENIYYGRNDARGIVCALIIDSGVSGRGHRKNIFSSSFGVAGVGYGMHAGYGAMCVIDFAARYVDRGGRLAGL